MKQIVSRQLTQVFELLGKDTLKKIALETGFIERERAFNAFQFLQFLFEQRDQLIHKSLETLCFDLEKDHQITITKSALNKRFSGEMVQFLHRILTSLFQLPTQVGRPLRKQPPFRRIRIMDSTTIQLPDEFAEIFRGVHCSSLKVHLEYDYLSQHLLYYEITNGRASDNPVGKARTHLIEKEELILQDLGYFDFEFFQEIEHRGAYFLTKTRKDTQFFVEVENPPLHPNGKKIERHRFQRLLLEEELLKMERGTMKEWPLVYVGKRQKMPVRCLLYRQTLKQEAQSTQREGRRRQKKQQQIHKPSVEQLLGMTVYITNIKQPELTIKQIHELYRTRWQIELLFKTWKSDLGVGTIRQVKLERWLCHLYTQLIVLFVSQWMTGSFQTYWLEKEGKQLSERKLVRTLSQQINRLLGAFFKSKKCWSVCLSQWIEITKRYCEKSIKHTTCKMP